MLTNDAILQRGRYRIIRCVTSVGGDCLYVAQDNVLFSEVIIHETSVDGKISTVSDHEALNEQFAETWRSLSAVDHPSILSIRGHFFEGHEHYLVTGPVEGTTVLETEPPLAKRSLGIAEHAAASMLDVLEYLREFSPSAGAVQMRPEYLW